MMDMNRAGSKSRDDRALTIRVEHLNVSVIVDANTGSNSQSSGATMAGRVWTTNEITQLEHALAAGERIDSIELPGRSLHAIRNKASRMGLIGDGVSRKPWSTEDEKLLTDLIRKAHSIREIHRQSLLPYSLNGLRKKAGRLGLVDQQRSERVRNACRFTADGMWYFRRFLQEHAANCTPEQIAQLWNEQFGLKVSRRRVIYHLTRLGLKQPWSAVIRMPYSAAKRQIRSPKAVKAQVARWRRYRVELESRLRDEALKLRRNGRGRKKRPAVRICRSCNRRWPGCTPFFHATRKTTRRGAREYLLRKCRLCVNEERRRRHGQKS